MAKINSEKTKSMKKEETKKLTVKEPLKKVTTKKVEKIAMKPEPKKVTTKEVKKLTVKPEPKRVTTKKIKQIAVKDSVKEEKKEGKKTVKKTVKSTPATDKKAYYDAMSLEDCIMNMQHMNVHYDYEDYAQLIIDEGNIEQLAHNIYEGNHLKNLQLDYQIHGYDQDLVKVTLNKVKTAIDSCEADFKKLKKEMDTSMKFQYGEDVEKNAEEYLKEFHLCERVLMLARRKHLHQLIDIDALLKTDIAAYTKHFMDLAYEILPTWQYNDVVFYEDFMYAYVSAFEELYLLYEQRIQLDCADLYIRHGDRERGNAGYDYLLRENHIKDYIYYRFAKVYENIDIEMAKSIAQSAMQYVDDRYLYYPNLIEIMNTFK